MSCRTRVGADQKRAARRRFARAMSFETLESRRVLTCGLAFAGGVVTLTCDSGNDIVSITTRDDGDLVISTNKGRLFKVYNGEVVEQLDVNLGAGSNRLNIDLSASDDNDGDNAGFSEAPIIHVTAGVGADNVTVNMGDNASDGGGGAGDDNGIGDVELSFVLGGGNDRLALEGVTVGGALTLGIDLGDGRDSAEVEYEGDLNDVDLEVAAGTGNDTFSMLIGGSVDGDWTASFDGGSGNDVFEVGIGEDLGGETDMDADLGSGNDSFAFAVGGDIGDSLFAFDVQGGAGIDGVGVLIFGASDASLELTGDLGAGNDGYVFLIGIIEGEGSAINEICQDVFIDLIGGSGNDEFFISLPTINGSLDVTLDTGTGGDAVYFYTGDLNGDSSVSMDLSSGDNYLEFIVFGDTNGAIAVDVAATTGADIVYMRFLGDMNESAGTEIDVDLGKGDDTLDFEVTGAIDFLMNVLMGDGNDVASLSFLGEIDGEYEVNFDAGKGNDQLTFTLLGHVSDGFNAEVTLDGFEGRDTLTLEFGNLDDDDLDFEDELDQIDLTLLNWEEVTNVPGSELEDAIDDDGEGGDQEDEED